MYFRQNHPLTLYKYFTRNLIQYFLIALFSLLTLIFFIDLVELFRRSSNKINVNHLQQAELIDILELTCKSISIDNYMEHGNPVLSCEQLDTCIHLACTEFHLNELVSKGLVESKLDLDTGQFVYRATDLGRSLIS